MIVIEKIDWTLRFLLLAWRLKYFSKLDNHLMCSKQILNFEKIAKGATSLRKSISTTLICIFDIISKT